MWHATSADLSLDLNDIAGGDGVPAVSADASYPNDPEPPPPLPIQIRAKAQAQRKTREAMAAGAVWAVLCAGFAMVLVGAVLFRVQIVRLYPSTAGAFAAVKLPVNPTGLSLENVVGGPGLTNGRATLVISGIERNVETETRSAAMVRVGLFDKAGKRIKDQVAPVDGPPLAPGETRSFTINIFDPPINIAEFQVEFVVDPPKPSDPRKTPHHPAKLALHKPLPLRGSTGTSGVEPSTMPEVAKPLPANSPYALPTQTGLRGGVQ